jgi:hypothetical protein
MVGFIVLSHGSSLQSNYYVFLHLFMVREFIWLRCECLVLCVQD